MIIEEVLVRLEDGERLSVTGAGVEPIGWMSNQHRRMCEIMARAIGQELGQMCETEEDAAHVAAQMSWLMLGAMTEEMERKPRA